MIVGSPPRAAMLLAANDCGIVDIQCKADNWFTELVRDFAQAAASLLGSAMTWWTRADYSSILRSPAIDAEHGLLLYVGMSVLVGGVMWQGIQMMFKRRAETLVNLGFGLVSYLIWSTLGAGLALTINEAGVALAGQVLNSSIHKFATGMQGALFGLVASSPALVLLLALVLFLLALVQWLLGFFRVGALVVLLALLPTAAAGQLNEATKPWLRKVLSWCLSLLLYQPLSAIVFSIGFELLGAGDGLMQVLIGCTILALAVVSMPTMLRFFDWGGQRLVSSSGGSGGGAMAMGAAANVAGGMSGFMSRNGPAESSLGAGGTSVAPANSGADPTWSSAPGPQGPIGPTGPVGSASAHSPSAQGTGSPDAGETKTGPPTQPIPTPGAGLGGRPNGAQTAGAGGAGGGTAGAAGAGEAASAGPAGAAVVAGQVAHEQVQRAQGAVTDAMTGGSDSMDSGDRSPEASREDS